MDILHADLLLPVLVSLAAACASLAVAAAVAQRRSGRSGSAGAKDELSLLMIDGRVADASPAGRRVIEGAGSADTDWDRVRNALSARFPDFPRTAPDDGHRTCHAAFDDDDGRAEVAASGGVVRIRVPQTDPPDAARMHLWQTARQNGERNGAMVAHAPYPIWSTDAAGQVDHANTAFTQLAAELSGDPGTLLDGGLPPGAGSKPRTLRVEVPADVRQGGRSRWFDVTSTPLAAGSLHHAIEMTPVVRAEIAQREFVQTLTKTFALLNMGLAIFDHRRRLSLFNPALIDLTALSPEFLSGQPALPSFFDALRERQVMPEPRNYVGWREAVSDVAARAAEGSFEETWTLPTGQTYRVTGQPYPNGAIAFLFDDISSEIEMSRRFHEHLRLGQSVLDSLDEAIVVFSRQGRMTTCNAAYLALWNTTQDNAVADVSVHTATAMWQAQAGPSRIWGDLRDFVSAHGPRCDWDGDVLLPDGRTLACRFSPLADGATLAAFRTVPQTAPVASLMDA